MTNKRALDLAIAAMTTRVRWYLNRQTSSPTRKRTRNERDARDALARLLEMCAECEERTR